MAAHGPSVANLGERAQNVQLRFGVTLLVVGLAASMAMRRLGAGGPAHWLLVPFFLLGTYGIAAAMTRICGFTAILGHRLTETGREPIADRRELVAVRRRGALVMGTSVVVSLLAVLLLSIAR
jgi:hypothetical protein